MCLWVVFPYWIHAFIDPFLGRFHSRLLLWLGGLISTLGYILAVWCVMLFITEGRGTPLPFAHPKRLVKIGPYRFVRNPMVLGTVLVLLGSAALLGSYGLLFYTFSIFLIMHFFILVEERSLVKRFGHDYAVYKQKTPRWWPRF